MNKDNSFLCSGEDVFYDIIVIGDIANDYIKSLVDITAISTAYHQKGKNYRKYVIYT